MFSALRSLVNSIHLVRLCAVIIKEVVDIIHVNSSMKNLVPILIAIILRRNYVVHFHGIEALGLIQRVLLKKVPRFIR